MAFINPFIKVNAGGIPRLWAINTPVAASDNSLTYDFNNHRFLNYPYAGLLIFKLPAVTAAASAGDVYFTTSNDNKTQVYDYSGNAVKSNDANIAKGGVFIGWYSNDQLLLLTGVA